LARDQLISVNEQERERERETEEALGMVAPHTVPNCWRWTRAQLVVP